MTQTVIVIHYIIILYYIILYYIILYLRYIFVVNEEKEKRDTEQKP